MMDKDAAEFYVGFYRALRESNDTPRRTIRVPDALWNAAQAKAKEQGTDVSAVIRKALERFVKRR